MSFFSTHAIRPLSRLELIASLILIPFLLHFKIVLGSMNDNFFGLIICIFISFIHGRSYHSKIPDGLLLGLILFFSFLSVRLDAKSLFLTSLVLSTIYLLYLLTHKLNCLVLFVLIFYSPIFDKIISVYTPNIKQYLTQFSYWTLKDLLNLSDIFGVHFKQGFQWINIDSSCMGLYMFKTGFLVLLILITLKEKIENLFYKYWYYFLLIVVCFFLNIFSNYFRIILLILLKNTQAGTIHYLIGIVCFLSYQILPLYILVRYFKPTISDAEPIKSNNISPYSMIISGALCLFLIYIGYCVKRNFNETEYVLNGLEKRYPIKNGKWVEPDVYKIFTENKLIYIKAKYHSPLVCWTGDGFAILDKKITEKLVRGKVEKVNLALITNQKDTIAAYYWFEHRDLVYTSTLKMNLQQILYGGKSRLINENYLTTKVSDTNSVVASP